MLTINKTVENEKAVLVLEGRLDTTTAPLLDKEIAQIAPDINELVLDVAAISYISSAGLRVLLAARKRMNPNGNMKVVNVGKSIHEIFQVTGFLSILNIE